MCKHKEKKKEAVISKTSFCLDLTLRISHNSHDLTSEKMILVCHERMEFRGKMGINVILRGIKFGILAYVGS